MVHTLGLYVPVLFPIRLPTLGRAWLATPAQHIQRAVASTAAWGKRVANVKSSKENVALPETLLVEWHWFVSKVLAPIQLLHSPRHAIYPFLICDTQQAYENDMSNCLEWKVPTIGLGKRIHNQNYMGNKTQELIMWEENKFYMSFYLQNFKTFSEGQRPGRHGPVFLGSSDRRIATIDSAKTRWQQVGTMELPSVWVFSYEFLDLNEGSSWEDLVPLSSTLPIFWCDVFSLAKGQKIVKLFSGMQNANMLLIEILPPSFNLTSLFRSSRSRHFCRLDCLMWPWRQRH